MGLFRRRQGRHALGAPVAAPAPSAVAVAAAPEPWLTAPLPYAAALPVAAPAPVVDDGTLLGSISALIASGEAWNDPDRPAAQQPAVVAPTDVESVDVEAVAPVSVEPVAPVPVVLPPDQVSEPGPVALVELPSQPTPWTPLQESPSAALPLPVSAPPHVPVRAAPLPLLTSVPPQPASVPALQLGTPESSNVRATTVLTVPPPAPFPMSAPRGLAAVLAPVPADLPPAPPRQGASARPDASSAFAALAAAAPVVPAQDAPSALEQAAADLLAAEQPEAAASRVQLGFRDGSTASLDPDSDQAAALEQLAILLNLRDG